MYRRRGHPGHSVLAVALERRWGGSGDERGRVRVGSGTSFGDGGWMNGFSRATRSTRGDGTVAASTRRAPSNGGSASASAASASSASRSIAASSSDASSSPMNPPRLTSSDESESPARCLLLGNPPARGSDVARAVRARDLATRWHAAAHGAARLEAMTRPTPSRASRARRAAAPREVTSGARPLATETRADAKIFRARCSRSRGFARSGDQVVQPGGGGRV